ncbi:MAG: hypothetical protein RLZZ546_1249, partial [Bacteroidota bacterium]
KWLYISIYERNHTLTEEEYNDWLNLSLGIISEEIEVRIENIFIKTRKIIEKRTSQYDKLNALKDEKVVFENGLKFLINLTDYLDTGLFLDHRITRKMVKEQSYGKNVLNLFAYTASFSVYAASGGASKVTTIDLSNTYTEWSKRNFELNGLSLQKHEFIAADVMKILNELENEKYDIIICDPPTFSNSKKMDGTLDTQRDHVYLINQSLKKLKLEGQLYFSTNYSKFKMDQESIESQNIKDITRATTPFDFEHKLERYCYLIKK